MRREDSEIVRELPLFRGVELENFRTLIAAGYVQRFPTGTVLIHEGERPDFLHVLVDGQIAFFASHNDREATVSILTVTVSASASVDVDPDAASCFHSCCRDCRRTLSEIGSHLVVVDGCAHTSRGCARGLRARHRLCTSNGGRACLPLPYDR